MSHFERVGGTAPDDGPPRGRPSGNYLFPARTGRRAVPEHFASAGSKSPAERRNGDIKLQGSVGGGGGEMVGGETARRGCNSQRLYSMWMHTP